MPTTSVRRRISLLSRSSELLLQSCRQCSFGNAVKASRSGPASSSSAAASGKRVASWRSEEHTSELQSRSDLVCRLLLEKKKKRIKLTYHSINYSMPQVRHNICFVGEASVAIMYVLHHPHHS